MVGCAAPNCSNNSRNGLFKFYRFPSDPIRRKKWLINSRRANWTPTIGNYLCNVHFEESQFEQHRMDNKKKLKPNAVPTLFSVPNPPKRLDDERVNVYNRICGNKNIAEGNVEDECEVMSQEDIPVIIDRLKKDIASLQKENEILKKEVEKINAILHQFLSEALTSAWFIRLINEWFSLLTSRIRNKSITKNNHLKKVKFLKTFLDIIQELKIGHRGGWKPLNTGSIMSTLSFIKLSDDLFKTNYCYILGSRFSQDGLENIFSQIRRKAGANPSALSCLQAVKLISISQYMTPYQNTSYVGDNDKALVDYCNLKKKFALTTKTYASLSNNNENEPKTMSLSEYNSIYYIAGSAVNAIKKKKGLCEGCVKFLSEESSKNISLNVKTLTEFSDAGNLNYVSSYVFEMCCTIEDLIQKHKPDLLASNINMDDIINTVRNHYQDVSKCCNVLKILLNHYTAARGLSLCKYLEAKRKLPLTFANRQVLKRQKIY